MYVYVTSDGILNVGTNGLTVSCSGCQIQSNITQFPANSFPGYNRSALSGAWSNGGGVDLRDACSTTAINGGTGIVVTQSLASTLSVNSKIVPVHLTGTATLTFTSGANASRSAEQTFSGPAVAWFANRLS